MNDSSHSCGLPVVWQTGNGNPTSSVWVLRNSRPRFGWGQALSWAQGLAFWLCLAARTAALDSSDLLFHLSFDDGLQPEFSRGSNEIALQPKETERRRVEGLFGKGYLFAGKASTIQYYTGDKGGRACWEMYSKKANLFGDSGTLSFWIKPLANTHNMVHPFFRCDDQCWIQVARSQYWQYQFCYGPARKGGYLYDSLLPADQWIHIAMTWRKDEARGYFDGRLASTVAQTGVLAPTPERFTVATEGMTWLDFQKKEFEDDAVMDELQIFRRPLTDEEIRSLFERGRVTVKRQAGNMPEAKVIGPEREFAGHLLTAQRMASPIKPDGDLSDWKGIPAHGGWIERRVGVLDDDPGRVLAACDDKNLYLGFSCEVDSSILKDPTHVMYPNGEFLATSRARDGDAHADDYVEFVLKSKEGREYRFALNSNGDLLDRRDGDKTWNGQVVWKGRSDFKNWTAELIVPLSDLGLKMGDTLDFNVIRSWKLFKSSQNALCADARGLPAFGKLTLGGFDRLTAGGAASASVEGLGNPARGDLALTGAVTGPAGDYTVKIRGKGFSDEKKVSVSGELARFEIKRRIEKPADMSVVAVVLDPAGKEILTRTIPFVYVAASTVELANYPGWGRLEVSVSPIGVDLKGMQAAVALMQGGKEMMKTGIEKFDDPCKTVRFDTTSLAVGDYEVFTKLQREGQVVGEDRQPYVKKLLPDWFHGKAGIMDGPPVPWTDVQVKSAGWLKRIFGKANAITVQCLIKEIRFRDTLFPAEIVANQQNLLNGPVRIRVKQNGKERVITAGKCRITEKTRRKADWESVATDGDLNIKVNGWIEFDGFTWMNLNLAGGKVEHLSVEIPLRREAVTLKNLDGIGPLTKPLKGNFSSYWFGNEKAGIQCWWEDQRGWVLNGEPVLYVTPTNTEAVIAIPFIQKATDLAKPRTVTFGWALTPSKPVRKDWRHIKLFRKGVTYTNGDYCYATPNYPKPRSRKEDYELMNKQMNSKEGPITCWYAFGTCQWVGSPEYADWWREWRWTPSELARPDPNSAAWAPACPDSSSANMHLGMLEDFVKHYPQRAIYFDCKQFIACDNEAHGCGWVDEKGARQPSSKILAQRRFYERVYNIHKAADPVHGWVRHHDWAPNMADGAFMDENWVGEGWIGPIMATPEKNYYRVVDLPTMRYYFVNENWGHLTSWLTELACSAGEDKEKRAEWYGKMLSPPRPGGDGKRGEWTLPRWKDYEHVAGLALIHNMWTVGGNDLQLPALVVDEMERRMRWDDSVQFIGYWELGDSLKMDGGEPEKIVCSVYHRPARKDAKGRMTPAWLMVVPMNNTDTDATITLRPNLKKFGLEGLGDGRWLDLYRATPFTFAPKNGWKANGDDPESPYIVIKPAEEFFPMSDGATQVMIPKRNFRALLLLGANEQPDLAPPSAPFTW